MFPPLLTQSPPPSPKSAHPSPKSGRKRQIPSENGEGNLGKTETRDSIRIPETARPSPKSDRKRQIPSENGEGRHATLPRKRPASPKSDRISPILCEGGGNEGLLIPRIRDGNGSSRIAGGMKTSVEPPIRLIYGRFPGRENTKWLIYGMSAAICQVQALQFHGLYLVYRDLGAIYKPLSKDQPFKSAIYKRVSTSQPFRRIPKIRQNKPNSVRKWGWGLGDLRRQGGEMIRDDAGRHMCPGNGAHILKIRQNGADSV